MNQSYEHLNLKYNPFGSLTDEEVSELIVPVLDFQKLADFLHSNTNSVIQIYGQKGRGKTTHLIGFHEHYFEEYPIVFLERNKKKPPIPKGDLIFVDGVHKLNRWQRWRLWRRNQNLVFVSHFDYSKEFENKKNAFLSFEIKGFEASHLKTILDKRIRMASIDSVKPCAELSIKTIESLIQKYGDNYRAIIVELYTLFQNLQNLKHV